MKASVPQNTSKNTNTNQNPAQNPNPAPAGKVNNEQMQNIKMRASQISSDVGKPAKKGAKSAMSKGFSASANIFFEIAAGGITGLFLAYMSSYFLHTGVGIYLLLGVFGLFGGLYGAFKKISSDSGFVVKNVDNSNADDTDEDELKVWKQ